MDFIFVALIKIFSIVGINNLYANVIITDIDDTLKITNSILIGESLKGFFYKDVTYFPAMKVLFNDLKNASLQNRFYYVSNSFEDIFDGYEWIETTGFPRGDVYQRDNLYDKVLQRENLENKDHKIAAIKNVLAHTNKNESYFFFGDNAQQDPEIYLDIVKKHQLEAHIFIRDIQGKNLFVSMLTYEPMKKEQVMTYTFDRDLWYNLDLFFMFNDYSLNTWFHFYMDTFKKSSLTKSHEKLLSKINSKRLCSLEKKNYKECAFKIDLMVSSTLGKSFRQKAPHGQYNLFR